MFGRQLSSHTGGVNGANLRSRACTEESDLGVRELRGCGSSTILPEVAAVGTGREEGAAGGGTGRTPTNHPVGPRKRAGNSAN